MSPIILGLYCNCFSVLYRLKIFRLICDKRPSYCRWTARRLMSVEILATAIQIGKCICSAILAVMYQNRIISKGHRRRGRFVRFGASWRAKFPKMSDFLLWMPMNRPAKFDADSFIFGGEIPNRTNKQSACEQ